MRPARKGPENEVKRTRYDLYRLASMRPARKGPENLLALQQGSQRFGGFNEAGPQGAGKL